MSIVVDPATPTFWALIAVIVLLIVSVYVVFGVMFIEKLEWTSLVVLVLAPVAAFYLIGYAAVHFVAALTF